MNQHSNPKIRFREFVNKWNNYKLGQLGNFKSGIGFPDSQQGGTEGIPFFKVSDMNNIGNETEMRNANNYVTEAQIMKNSWKVINETPAIIFAKVGAALMLNRKRLVTRPFLIDNNTMSYSFDESWDKDFGLTLFQTINLPKYAQIGALPSYNASDIAMIKVNVPNVQEQSAIGSLFRTLDDLLTNYKDNLANYQSLKVTMRSKMFPKVGQTVPEIRLDRFEGEWEEKYIGELADIVRGASPRPIQDPKWFNPNSEIGWLRISDVTSQNGRIHSLEQKISKLGQEKTRVLTEPHLLLSIAATVGKPVVNYVKTGVHDGFLIFMNPKFDREFMFQWLEMYREKWNRYGQPGSQVNLNSDIVKNQKILVPSMEEQQVIGTYFSNLDNLISAHQEKISQLETLKKKLLQDMFI